MRVFCESCNQQYNINEEYLKAGTSRFKCKRCSHFIVVKKPGSTIAETSSEEAAEKYNFASSLSDSREQPDSNFDWSDMGDMPDQDTSQDTGLGMDSSLGSLTPESATPPVQKASSVEDPPVHAAKKSGRGIPLQIYLSITFLIGLLAMTVILVLLNKRFVPVLINEQIDLRTAAISKSFSGAVKQPLLVRNYLRVNQEAERVAQLPGVAYASVINKRNIVIAGVFSKPSLFQPTFLEMVQRTGFPQELSRKNNLNPGEEEKSSEFTIGGQPIYDVAISLGKVGGEVHVGLFTADIQAAIQKTLIPVLIVISILFFFGLIGYSILARFISKPLRDLTRMADRISMGEIDEQILPKGPREVRDLSRSLDRMRISIREALKLLRK